MDDAIRMCIGCHGIPGYKTAFPTVYHVPKIAGQQPGYLLNALRAYKSGERSHRRCAASLRRSRGRHEEARRPLRSAGEMRLLVLAIAMSLAGVAGAADLEAGKKKAAEVCGACHGPEGNKPLDPTQPVLAGQHYDYLVRALTDYKIGKRSNPIMKGFASQLSKKEIEDVRRGSPPRSPACTIKDSSPWPARSRG
jgi:cytochrome c553